jgi:hypothetical protein
MILYLIEGNMCLVLYYSFEKILHEKLLASSI